MGAMDVLGKFPKSLEEFLEQQNLDEWPERLEAEGSLLVNVDSVMGSKDDIKDTLKAAAPLRLEVLDGLEDRLLQLESQLVQYSSLTLTDTVRPSKFKDHVFHVPKKVEIMEEKGDGIQVFRHELEKKQKRKIMGTDGDQSSKSVDSIHFPGFYPQEMLEFPGQYEAPVLMVAVTNRQTFNPGFMKFWKRIFLSEASIAIMQDLFWWIFLDRFEGRHDRPSSQREGRNSSAERMSEREVALGKDRLFNRIADSFVNMLFSIHPDMKDKFLNVYPNVLAQTVFASYTECFPISKILFDDSFKDYVASICFQWVSGVKPSPAHLRTWRVERLMASNKDAAESVPDTARSDHQLQLPEVMESNRTTPRKTDAPQQHTGDNFEDFVSGRSLGKGTNRSHKMFKVKRPTKKQSMPAMGSDEMERLPFSIYGRSPLVAHWLHSKSLAGKSQHTTGPNTMLRVQVERLNQETTTFADVISEVKENAVTRKNELTRIERETKKEIKRIDENLKNQLRSLKALESKIAKDAPTPRVPRVNSPILP